MIDNPYEPPIFNRDDGTDPLPVTVHRRLAMDMTAERVFRMNFSESVFADHLQRAAAACSFSVVEQRDQQWLLKRGSQWHALYTFCVRKIPTIATVTILSPEQIHVSFRCRSVFQVYTRRDGRELVSELAEFVKECMAGT